jgi:hypothetical protein
LHPNLAPYPCLAPNQAPNLTLTEIEIQSQKPAPHYTKRLLVYLYLYPHHLILAWFVCLAPAPYPLLSTLPLTHPPAPQRCRKALKNKHLLDVCKALKVKGFTHCGKLAERMRKGCGKTCGIKQIVENQALRENSFRISAYA